MQQLLRLLHPASNDLYGLSTAAPLLRWPLQVKLLLLQVLVSVIPLTVVRTTTSAGMVAAVLAGSRKVMGCSKLLLTVLYNSRRSSLNHGQLYMSGVSQGTYS